VLVATAATAAEGVLVVLVATAATAAEGVLAVSVVRGSEGAAGTMSTITVPVETAAVLIVPDEAGGGIEEGIGATATMLDIAGAGGWNQLALQSLVFMTRITYRCCRTCPVQSRSRPHSDHHGRHNLPHISFKCPSREHRILSYRSRRGVGQPSQLCGIERDLRINGRLDGSSSRCTRRDRDIQIRLCPRLGEPDGEERD
jgi:hypothetical protein